MCSSNGLCGTLEPDASLELTSPYAFDIVCDCALPIYYAPLSFLEFGGQFDLGSTGFAHRTSSEVQSLNQDGERSPGASVLV